MTKLPLLLVLIAIPPSQCFGRPFRPGTLIKFPDSPLKGPGKDIGRWSIPITLYNLWVSWNQRHQFPHLNPGSPSYYTNVYRWCLRYFGFIPEWLSDKGLKYTDTHKLWTRRFYYMDEFMPSWLRKIFPYVDEEDFIREKKDFEIYATDTQPYIGKYYRYPSKKL